MSINIALDGPSGAGKSTIAKMLAKKMEYVYVDTGALYRAIALFMLRNDVDISDDDKVVDMLPQVEVNLSYVDGAQQVLLCGENVSDKIRTPEVSMGASRVSAIPQVRQFLFDLQRNIAKTNNIIMDGRDIGTVVLPNADVKIFLTATAEERANRRFKELQEKGDTSTYEEVLADINQRDYNDTHRDVAPLKKADDAVEIDSTNLDLEQAVQAIYDTIQAELAKKNTEKKEERRSSLAAKREAFDFSGIEPVGTPKKYNKLKLFGYAILRVFVTFCFKIAFNLKVTGKENVPKTGSNIFASNHRSYLDPIFIATKAKVPNSYMAKDELFRGNKFFTWLIKYMGAFPVVRGSGDSSVITTSIEKLRSGRNLIIFPEGTRSKDGTLGRGKTGVALIAAVAQVPVVPVAVSFKGEKLKFRSKVIVSYGKPISPEELKIDSADTRAMKRIKTTIMNGIAELVNENVNKL